MQLGGSWLTRKSPMLSFDGWVKGDNWETFHQDGKDTAKLGTRAEGWALGEVNSLQRTGFVPPTLSQLSPCEILIECCVKGDSEPNGRSHLCFSLFLHATNSSRLPSVTRVSAMGLHKQSPSKEPSRLDCWGSKVEYLVFHVVLLFFQ